MRNYILIYNISDNQSEKELIKQLKKKFHRNRSIIENNYTYFLFAEKKLPGVQDALQEIMDRLKLNEPDYIALYYTREEEPDIINRLMVFGTSNLIENDLKKISGTIHERVLSELLEFDFIRQK
jgi:hypothetical protein